MDNYNKAGIWNFRAGKNIEFGSGASLPHPDDKDFKENGRYVIDRGKGIERGIYID